MLDRTELSINPDHIPFEKLQYLLTEIHYGGRIDDDLDKKLLSSLLKNYFHGGILNPNYLIAGLRSFKIPESESLSEVMAFIDQMPPVERHRKVTGLHQNS